MSIIETLITDRTKADVDAGNEKGSYQASDLNRVGAAMNYVAERLLSAGYDPHIHPKTDWTDAEWPTAQDMTNYLSDLAELRKQVSVFFSTPVVPSDMEKPTVQEANDIERILLDIDTQLSIMATTFIPCGDALCGGDNL